MVDLHDIRYLRIGTPDLQSAVEFATKIVALQLAGREGKAAYFRRDKQFLAFEDPTGNKVEIVVRPPHSGERYFPARDAGITHFSHIGLRTSNASRDEAFWTRLLNARVSDWIGDAPLLRIGTIHHTLALFPSPHPGVQHINHQVEDFDDVMRSYYFLREKGVRIVFGPGRHPSSSACFLYFEGPDKMVYEYSLGVKHILPEEEASYRPRQFPFAPESFCMWGSRPDIPEFRADQKDKKPPLKTVA